MEEVEPDLSSWMESFDSVHGHVDEVVELAAAMHVDHAHTEEMVVDDKKKVDEEVVDEKKKMDEEIVVADKIKVDEKKKKEDAEMMVLALHVPSIYHSSCERCITPPIGNMCGVVGNVTVFRFSGCRLPI
jgi:hypothetical protein